VPEKEGGSWFELNGELGRLVKNIGKSEIIAFFAGVVSLMLVMAAIPNSDDNEDEILIWIAATIAKKYPDTSVSDCNVMNVEFTDEFGVQRQIVVLLENDDDDTWYDLYEISLKEDERWPIYVVVESPENYCYLAIMIKANYNEIGSAFDEDIVSLNATAVYGM